MECRFCGATFATLPESGNCPKCNFRIESAPVVEGKVCACGIQNKANAKFCRSCGTPLGLAPAAPAAPRILPGLKFVASPAPRVERDAQAPAAPDRIMPELKFAAAPADPVVRAPEPLAATPRKPYAWYFAGGALAVVLAGVGIAVRVQGGGRRPRRSPRRLRPPQRPRPPRRQSRLSPRQ